MTITTQTYGSSLDCTIGIPYSSMTENGTLPDSES